MDLFSESHIRAHLNRVPRGRIRRRIRKVEHRQIAKRHACADGGGNDIDALVDTRFAHQLAAEHAPAAFLKNQLDFDRLRARPITNLIIMADHRTAHIFAEDAKFSANFGYHFFHAQDRGKGIGAKMLGLLQQYVVHATEIKRLIIITGYNNGASRGIALTREFNDRGSAWEDPENLVVYAWAVTRA